LSKIIDSLTYIGGPIVGPDGFLGKKKAKFFGAEELIKVMDDNNIDMAVTMPYFGDWTEDYMPQNRYVADAQKKYPDRLVGFCWLNPKYGQKAIDDLETCINKLGLRGVKLGPRYDGYLPYGWGYELLLNSFYEKVSKLEVPMIIHCSGPSELETPSMISIVADKFPDIKIIMTHCGGPRMEIDSGALISRFRNLYGETSETHSSFAIVTIINQAGADKVLFGSDTPFIGPEIEKRKLDIALELKLITPEQYRLVMGENIAKILNIKA